MDRSQYKPYRWLEREKAEAQKEEKGRWSGEREIAEASCWLENEK